MLNTKLELRPYQTEILDIMDKIEPGKYLIQLATGLGKCFAKDTKILMYDGTIKNVQDIIIGDLLMGNDSNKREVMSLANGIEQMYEIKQNKKDSYIVNESHILSLKCTNLNNKVKYIYDVNGNKYTNGDICNISVKDYLKCSKKFKHVMKGHSAPIEFKHKDIIIPPYFLGLWLGDGTSRTLSITTPDDEIINYIYEFADNFNMNVRVEYLKDNKSNTYHLSKNYEHTKINKYMRENLYLNKHIPEDYKLNSKEIRLQILAGLLDADGYLHGQDHSTFEIISKYKRLSDDIAFIVRSLGLSCYQSIKHNKKYNKNYYRCSIFGETSIIPTKIQRKQAKNNSNKNNLMYGIDVIPRCIDKYYGFEIKGNNRLFLLNDFTVVHNTVCFTNFVNTHEEYNVLILSHREELVNQPVKYITRSVGIEKGSIKSNGESVISACVPSLVRRLEIFPHDYFDVIITDECHRACAKSYTKIYEYFNFKYHFGFTATPNRNDNIKLKGIFDKIVYKMSLLDGIKQGYLTDIRCIRSYLNYDLRNVKSKDNDYRIQDLEEEMSNTSNAIAEIYEKHSVGQTLIFAVSVKHAYDIAEYIPGSVVVDANTKNRSKIIEDFTNRKFRCLINCMIFTEGTDIPLIETIIIARPTKNESLYIQMVGRGLRLYPGKDKLTLIDCVGVSDNCNLVTVPSLVGLQYLDKEDQEKEDSITDSLFDLPKEIEKEMDNIDIWKINYKLVNIWAKGKKFQTHNVNWYKMPNGDFTLKLPNTKCLILKCPNELDESNNNRDFQDLLDGAYEWLEANHDDKRYLWDLNIMKKWGKYPASEKQINTIKNYLGECPPQLNKLEACQILNRLFNK